MIATLEMRKLARVDFFYTVAFIFSAPTLGYEGSLIASKMPVIRLAFKRDRRPRDMYSTSAVYNNTENPMLVFLAR